MDERETYGVYRGGRHSYEAVPGGPDGCWGVARLRARFRFLRWRFGWVWDHIVSVHDGFGEADEEAKRLAGAASRLKR